MFTDGDMGNSGEENDRCMCGICEVVDIRAKVTDRGIAGVRR